MCLIVIFTHPKASCVCSPRPIRKKYYFNCSKMPEIARAAANWPKFFGEDWGRHSQKFSLALLNILAPVKFSAKMLPLVVLNVPATDSLRL